MTAIRRAAVDDADAIAAVHMRTWQAAYRGLMPSAFLDQLDVAARADRWRRNLAGDGETFVVANEASQIQGFCSLLAALDDDQDPENTGLIAALYIEPACWRRRLGDALMQVATERANERGFKQLTLWVLEGNHNARRFYEAQGFRADGRTKAEDFGGATLQSLRYVTDRA